VNGYATLNSPPTKDSKLIKYFQEKFEERPFLYEEEARILWLAHLAVAVYFEAEDVFTKWSIFDDKWTADERRLLLGYQVIEWRAEKVKGYYVESETVPASPGVPEKIELSLNEATGKAAIFHPSIFFPNSTGHAWVRFRTANDPTEDACTVGSWNVDCQTCGLGAGILQPTVKSDLLPEPKWDIDDLCMHAGIPGEKESAPDIVVPCSVYQWNPIGDTFKIARILKTRAGVGFQTLSPDNAVEHFLDFVRDGFAHEGVGGKSYTAPDGSTGYVDLWDNWLKTHPSLAKVTWHVKGLLIYGFNITPSVSMSALLELFDDAGETIPELQQAFEVTVEALGGPQTFVLENTKPELAGCRNISELFARLCRAVNIPAGIFLLNASPGKLDWCRFGEYHGGVRIGHKFAIDGDRLFTEVLDDPTWELVPFTIAEPLLANMISALGPLESYSMVSASVVGEVFDSSMFQEVIRRSEAFRMINLCVNPSFPIIPAQVYNDFAEQYHCFTSFRDLQVGPWGAYLLLEPWESYAGSDEVILNARECMLSIIAMFESQPPPEFECDHLWQSTLLSDPLMQAGAVPPIWFWLGA